MKADDLLQRNYNVAYSRRRFIKPMIPDSELRELAELEKLCFPPPENYDLRTLRMYVSLNGAGLLRRREIVDGKPKVIAFHLFDCIAGELITLDVHPDFRRMGLGRMLYSESLAKLKELGHTQAVCQVATTNTSSLALHKGFGFKTVRTIRNYYGPGRDAFLLALELKQD